MANIAIIGSGISGLASAYFLDDEHNITVFEKDSRIGGHAHTISVTDAKNQACTLDTGFMVYNEVTYPLLTKLFQELGVKTKPTSMSFSVRHDPANLEFNGGSLNLLFGQRKNLLRPRFWKMLLQINRFNNETIAMMQRGETTDLTLAEYVQQRGYGQDFLNWYLSPMASAVWSTPPEKIAPFPAQSLLRFWYNHGFLGLTTQHPWRTVENGSQQYVEKLRAKLRANFVTNAHIREISPAANGHEIHFTDAPSQTFDQVIFACHPDQALTLLGDHASPQEREILSKFHYQKNRAVVHSDARVMPRTQRCWASWNYQVSQRENHQAYTTHYWMNSLQGVSENSSFWVSINPSASPREIHRELDYEHPLFDLPALQAQETLTQLHHAAKQTKRWFCGAWQRYGFHEDGIWSANRMCKELTGKERWSL